MIQKTLGGDRLGSGKKQKVTMHGYERSTHDMGYIWRSTMSAGTLVPFMVEPILPGDTFDINLDVDIKTHPTVGPLFGSYKVQLDVFTSDIRLYQGQLHNNKLGIGLKMSDIKLPQMRLYANINTPGEGVTGDIDNTQINPSALLSYLNIRGVGRNPTEGLHERDFNAVPLLMYWDTYKNYYANKQETGPATGTIGAMVFTENNTFVSNVTTLKVKGTTIPPGGGGAQVVITEPNAPIEVTWGAAPPTITPGWAIILMTSQGDLSLDNIAYPDTATTSPYTFTQRFSLTGTITITGWRYITPSEIPQRAISIATFQLKWLDDMREQILAATIATPQFYVNDFMTATDPYYNILNWTNGVTPYMASQQGLGIKTYQSDLFNNWLNTEIIDGTGGINDITAVSTVGDEFKIDALLLSKKVYDMLNRIAVSGGTYDDWIQSVYDDDRFRSYETPVYQGGLIKELVFQEVVSNAQAAGADQAPQPLGTLAGRGAMAQKHKGGKISISAIQPGYVMGIVSLTPRIDYSQGNKWDTQLKTMDDFHKPQLDEIGFQELITEQMTWFDTSWDGTNWVQKSAGKQPAWINYMTNVNQTRGNFAIQDNEMFMTLNRRYEYADGLLDLTTYIDPTKYNHIFADTALDAQNFWVQIAVDITARRKMSAKVMPNL